MFGIFLDDERNPEDVTWIKYPENVDWFVVRRMNDFLFAIFNMEDEEFIVSFDHDIADKDLTGKEVTGYDCLKAMIIYMEDHPVNVRNCYFHTQNPVGRENMAKYWDNYLRISES